MTPLYRHKKTGNLYRLLAIRLALRSYQTGDTVDAGLFSFPFTVTDPILEGEFFCCYQVDVSVATPENPMKGWARAAEMFFDGRFYRVSL